MSDKNSSSEPSMEQILESIAEIIADDQVSPAQDTAPSYEAVPVMHALTPVNSDAGYATPAPAFLQSSSDPIAPVAEPVSTGSLTDRLANMTPSTPGQATEPLPVRPVPEDVALTPPGFMGQEVSSHEPISVNTPIPQMMGQQPTMSAQGFPVESAEDFLANNAKRVEADAFAPQQMAETVAPQIPVQQAPEFALNPALVPTVTLPEPVVQTAPIEPQVVEAVSQPEAIEQPVPQEQEVALSGFAQPPAVQQPAPEQTVAPVEVAPIVSSPADDVLNSFHQVEEEQVSDVPVDHSDVSLLDASYMSTAAQTPLVAEPVMAQVETVTATTVPAAMQNPVLATEEVKVEAVSDVSGADLNSAIHAMVQPMVKKWLDENLSKVVEEVVRNELTSALTKK